MIFVQTPEIITLKCTGGDSIKPQNKRQPFSLVHIIAHHNSRKGHILGFCNSIPSDNFRSITYSPKAEPKIIQFKDKSQELFPP